MKAAVRYEYGPPEVVRVEEVRTPEPAADELLVRVQAAAVNLGDWELLTGKPRYIPVAVSVLGPRVRHPVLDAHGRRRRGPRYKILGTDLAGLVEAVGSRVTSFRPGDEVFGECVTGGAGAFAEAVCVPEKAALTTKPPSLSFEQAAALPESTFIALRALRDVARVQSGQRVLINGAGGGAGTLGVQLAKAWGAEVTAVDGPHKLDLLRSLGADHVVDYTAEDYSAGDRRYDVILDLAAHRSVFDSRRALAPGGLYMMTGGSWQALWQSLLVGPVISRFGQRRRVRMFGYAPKSEQLTAMIELFEAGKVRPVIDRCYPLEEIGEALRRVGEGRSLGKVIVTPTARA